MIPNRVDYLTNDLLLSEVGLEISPLFRPITTKEKHNVFFTDYCSAEESRLKHAHYDHAPIMDIDFVWNHEKRLIDCVPEGMKFNWAISSHVLEHVPDPIGWLIEIFEVLKPGAALSLALPDKRYSFDLFRRETEVSELIDNWVRKQRIPSPKQLYDFLSMSVNDSGEVGKRPFEFAKHFIDCPRTYTDRQALEFVKYSWEGNHYLDAHCSVFSPESFISVFNKINQLGILNISISNPIVEALPLKEHGEGEFIVKLTKLGEPSIGPFSSITNNPIEETQTNGELIQRIAQLEADLLHARNAFAEAVVIQNQLKDTQTVRKKLKELIGWKSWRF